MAKIKLTLPGLEIPVTGKQVSFVAPCDCSAVDGIQIDGVDYDVVDSVGNTVPFGHGVWSAGATLTVILNVENQKAYLQNHSSLSRFLGGLGNEYVWEKRGESYEIQLGAQTEAVGVTNVSLYYSDSIEIVDGEAVLVNPQQSSPGVLQNALNGKYFSGMSQANGGKVSYCIECYEAAYWNVRYEPVTVVKKSEVLGYVNSPDPSAYPIDDGYTYKALGQLGDKARIATGSYKGTGTYGVNNPSSLKFNFKPKVVFVFYTRVNATVGHDMGNALGTFVFNPYGIRNDAFMQYGYYATNVPTNNQSASYSKFDDATNTLFWYQSSAGYQANESNGEYFYVAIG